MEGNRCLNISVYKDKKNISMTARMKGTIVYREMTIRLRADILTVTMKTKTYGIISSKY